MNAAPTRAASLLVALGAIAGACSSDESGSATPHDSGLADVAFDSNEDGTPPDAGLDAPADVDKPLSNAPIEIDLGAITAGTPVTVSIPTGTLGFHVVVRRASGGFVGVERITSPSGQDVVVDFTVVGAGGPTTSGSAGIGAATVAQNPLASAMPVEVGDWQILPSVGGPSEPLTAKVYVQQTDDGAFHGGVLDLQLYLPEGLQLSDPGPAHTVNVSSAATDPSVTTRVDAFFDALGELFGIDRGETTFVAISAQHRVISDDAGLQAAIAQSKPPKNGTALHVVLANGISVFGTEVWGISTGIPGAAVETGHPQSGIALNVSAGFPANADGWTLVHELGHYAGLFHSSQPDGLGGVMSDPLDDTPSCTSFSPSCPDGKNIMFAAFWGASGGLGIVSSDQQRTIVRGSPLYRTYPNGALADFQRPARSGPAHPASLAGLCGNQLLELSLRTSGTVTP